MSSLEITLQKAIFEAAQAIFGVELPEIVLQPTRREFEGSHTFVTFGLAKQLAKSPDEVGNALGGHLLSAGSISRYNVVKGFLNLVLPDVVWREAFTAMQADAHFGTHPARGERVMVEFASPNTNKPLHLGHLRNIFLGDAVSRLYAANGYEVIKANLVNDRGIHICKSMVAYEKFGEGITPAQANLKGDHLVGKYYVEFGKALREESSVLLAAVEQGDLSPFTEAVRQQITALQTRLEQATGNDKKEKELRADLKQLIENQTYLMREAQTLLQEWENGDPETRALWAQLNDWVYEGFAETLAKIKVSFDKTYYESETYLLGREIVEEGLAAGVFYRKEDGSVWIDLTGDKLDHKLVRRADGTSVYITQDLGTAELKFADYQLSRSVYVVGDEQEYHFKVLFKILEKLGKPYAPGLFHLSYGMVELPSGRMKTREGTVVDADDIIAEMCQIAQQKTEALGKVADLSPEEHQRLYQIIGIGALKYFLLKVDPRKRIIFNPEESVDFQGDAAPFIQYNYARIQSILRKAAQMGLAAAAPATYAAYTTLHPNEQMLIQLIAEYPKKLHEAAQAYSPSIIAQFAYELVRAYSRFWTECSIYQADTDAAKHFRVALSALTGKTIKLALGVLGIEVPERM